MKDIPGGNFSEKAKQPSYLEPPLIWDPLRIFLPVIGETWNIWDYFENILPQALRVLL